MSELYNNLRRVTAHLDEIDARYALVGGMAISLRIEPRFTRDLDIAVAVKSDAQAESLARELVARGYSILAQSEYEAVKRLATVRLAVSEGLGVVVDLLFASSGDVIVERAEVIEALPGWVAPVARSEHLLAMKLLAGDPVHRPQDLVDATALLRTMTNEQIEKSRQALRLIEQRGFNRKKSLMDQLDAALGAMK